MRDNYLIFPLSEMMEYVHMSQELDNALDWAELLKLKERLPVSLIRVTEDGDGAKVLAYAEWRWKDKELKIGKIEVHELLRERKVGNTLMNMLIAIAKHYEASKITGTVAGKEFLWNWYKKLGFTIYNDNKMMMELRKIS